MTTGQREEVEEDDILALVGRQAEDLSLEFRNRSGSGNVKESLEKMGNLDGGVRREMIEGEEENHLQGRTLEIVLRTRRREVASDIRSSLQDKHQEEEEEEKHPRKRNVILSITQKKQQKVREKREISKRQS